MVETTVPRVDDEGKPALDVDGNMATRALHRSRREEPLLTPVAIRIGFASSTPRLVFHRNTIS